MDNQELIAKIAELQKNQNILIDQVDKLAHGIGAELQANRVYLSQLDKNIMVHDDLINKICCAIGVHYVNKPENFN